MIKTNKTILGFNLIWLYHKKELMREILAEIKILDLQALFVGNTLEFDQVQEAIKLFQSGKTTGKVVITLND